jgi:hypothetical protein
MRLALLAVVLLVTGCSGWGPTEEGSGPQEHLSLLQVLVISDEYLPVQDARVRIVGLGLNATTGDTGEAAFVVPSGHYVVAVHHPDFYPNSTPIEIQRDADRLARIRLRDAPDSHEFSDFHYVAVLCGVTLWLQGVDDDSACEAGPNFPPPRATFELAHGLVEANLGLDWDAQTGGAQRLRMEVRFLNVGAFADGTDVLVGQGTSPVSVHVPPELVTQAMRRDGTQVEVIVGLDQREPIAFNGMQTVHIHAEFRYFEDAPDVDHGS